MKLRLPEKVNRIIKQLKKHGYDAYAVGGCVRDSILMRNPDDWDITTSAKPEEVKEIFARTIDTGLQHGTVTVLLEGDTFEVTTYRIDGVYEDGRHPTEVVFTPNLEEDLKRRDFTINAMAYSDEVGLVDVFGGMRDLQLKVIRCVGNPKERFNEDALRILRAIRFAAQLGFTIAPETKAAIRELAPNLEKISAERIQVEMVKLMTSDHPEFLELAYELGVTKVILPEFDAAMTMRQNNPHHMYTVGVHTLKSVTFVHNDKALRLAMLFHDLGKVQTRKVGPKGIDHFFGHADVSAQIAGEVLKRLRFDNDTYRKVTKLVKWHDRRPEANGASIRRTIRKMGEDLFPMYLEVMRADILAQSSYNLEEKTKYLERVREIYEHILTEEHCISLKQLAISGKDLIDMGMPPGSQIGETLAKALNLVLDKPYCNVRAYLLNCVIQNKFE